MARWTWPLCVLLLTIAVYGRTLAPSITWRHYGADGGDLISAAATLGVPHPSGYPTYVLLARLFLRLLPLGEPAARVTWLSALCGAAAVTLLARSVVDSVPSCRATGWTAPVAAASAALLMAFSSLMWGQATIAEVHALNLAFVAALFWLLLRWRANRWQTTGSAALLGVTGVLYGLCLGNHLTSLLLLPAGLAWLLGYRKERSLEWRGWLAATAGVGLGLLVYVYLPWAAARQPPINWGDTQTWPRFWWLVSGRLYRDAVIGMPWSEIPGRLSAWAQVLLQQFGWLGWALALTGVWDLSRRDRPLLGLSLWTFVAYSVYGLTYDRADSVVYLLPASLMVAFWLGNGLVVLLQTLQDWSQRLGQARERGSRPPCSRKPRQDRGPQPGRGAEWAKILVPIAALAIILWSAAPLVGNFAAHDLRGDWEAVRYAAEVLEAVEPGALVISSGDRSSFALWYYRYAREERQDVTIVNANLWSFDWYRHTVATNHPQIVAEHSAAPPADLQALIDANLLKRSVYITEDAQPVLSDYPMEAAGPLYRLR